MGWPISAECPHAKDLIYYQRKSTYSRLGDTRIEMECKAAKIKVNSRVSKFIRCRDGPDDRSTCHDTWHV